MSGKTDFEKYNKQDVYETTLGEDQLSITYYFEEPEKVGEDGSLMFLIEGLENSYIPNEPILPMRTGNILIPKNKEVSEVVIEYEGKELIANGIPKIAELPLWFGENISEKDQAQEIEEGEKEELLISEIYGESILNIRVFPIDYDFEKKDFFFYKKVKVTVFFKEELVDESSSKKIEEEERELLAEIIDNPEAISSSYPEKQFRILMADVGPLTSYDYVIITSEEFENYNGKYNFQALLAQKQSRSAEPITGTIVTVESILTDPTYNCDGLYGDGCAISAFNDSAARIRNFIRFAYEVWDTEYVLLGGDVSIIPVRSFYINLYRSDVPATNIPSDMYYANLDGSMNANLDSAWGWSSDGVDFLSDVYVGRAPVETTEQLSNFVRKTMLYETLAVARDGFVKNALSVYDPTISTLSIPTSYLNKYSYNVTTQSTTSAGWIANYLNVSSIVNAPAIINHAGHGSTSYLSAYGSFSNTINNYPNFFYSQACLVGGFDNNDSFAEKLVYSQNSSYAVLMNSRYGWYTPNSPSSGPGNIFMNEFWYQVLYKDVKHLGMANQISKYNKLNSWGDYTKWLYWTQNLLGDPEISIFFYPTQISLTSTIVSPVVGSYYNNETIFVNVTCTNCTASWWGNGSANYTSSMNFVFPAGNNTIYAYANDSYGNLNSSSVDFMVDLELPQIFQENISGDFRRNTTVYFNFESSDNYGISNEIVESNLSGVLFNYTRLSANVTEGEVIVANISSAESSFSYRIYVEDYAGNINITDWRLSQILNTPPVFDSLFEEQSFFILSNNTLFLDDLFSDIDGDELTFSISESENLNFSLSDESLFVYAKNSIVSNGFIIIVANDSKNTTSQRINVSFVRPSFVPLGSDNFDGDTTNLSSLSSYVSVPLIVEKTSLGRISFSSVNLSQNISVGTHINISANKIFVNSTALPGLNSSATISLSLVNFNSNYATIYKDGEICSSCSVVSFNTSSKVIVFSVGGFSEYEVRAQTCSDGIKNQDENGVDCGGSCLDCSVAVVSSGGGGGGGGSTKLIPALPSIFSQASLESGVNFSVRVNNSVVFDLNNDVNLYFSEVNESYLVLKINNFSGQKISVGERVNLSVGEIVYLIYQNYSFGRANIFAQMIVPVEEKGEDVEFSGPYSPFSERIYTFFSDNILLAVVLFLVVLLMLIPRKTKGNK